MSVMEYHNPKIAETAALLKDRFPNLQDKNEIRRAVELKALAAELPQLAPEERAAFGKELNQLKQEIESLVAAHQERTEALPPIDVTAPFDINTPAGKRPKLLPTEQGSRHPLMVERDNILDIFYRMGFTASESREIDDDYHMFTALNFPKDHPARDDYDTFITEEGLVAPAHTSTMQNRILKQYKIDLESGKPIAVVVPDRVFRNEDVDARHEHTFYQIEGIYVDQGIQVGHLIATLKAYLKGYYHRDLDVKIQPFYFPFTEPSFEFAASCPFCGQNFESGKLEFLRQFK
jgi:phenylalanyl-tRNA synthetase alpha chain